MASSMDVILCLLQVATCGTKPVIMGGVKSVLKRVQKHAPGKSSCPHLFYSSTMIFLFIKCFQKNLGDRSEFA